MSRRTYAGRGVPTLPSDRSTTSDVAIPSQADATLLPLPFAVIEGRRADFLAARGATNPNAPADRQEPKLTLADVRRIANFITYALRNDLPLVDAHDAAVIWEQWRKAVVDLRDIMRQVQHDMQASVLGSVLWIRAENTQASLTTALEEPRAVFSRYCPWRADWATYDRIHPEAV